MRRLVRTLLAAAVCCGVPSAFAANPDTSGDAIDTTAPAVVGVVPMFDAIDAGLVDARIVMQNALRGRLILANTTDEEVNVQLPVAFGAQHVLAQFGGGGGGFGGGLGGGGGGGGQTTGGGGGLGGGGGGLGGGGGGFGGPGGGAGGFFSIPAKKSVTVDYHSVCLEHGKPEPRNKMHYVPVKLDDVAADDAMKAFLMGVSASRGSDKAMQAAGWHLTGMSWQELAAEKHDRVGAPDEPYFSRAELTRARQMVAASHAKAAEMKKADNPRR